MKSWDLLFNILKFLLQLEFQVVDFLLLLLFVLLIKLLIPLYFDNLLVNYILQGTFELTNHMLLYHLHNQLSHFHIDKVLHRSHLYLLILKLIL